MDNNFIQWIIGQGGIAGVAGLALFLVKRSYEDLDKARREQIENERSRNSELLDALKENTRVMAALEPTLRDLKQVVGNCALAQRVQINQ